MAAGDERSPDAGAEHRLPAPERLFPERGAEEGGGGVAALLIPAPGIVHQQVQVAVLPADLLEQAGDVRVDGVVAAHRHAGSAPPGHLLRRLLDAARTPGRRRPATCAAPGDVHGRAVVCPGWVNRRRCHYPDWATTVPHGDRFAGVAPTKPDSV